MNKRKIILLAALLVMVAILGVGGTLAYFTAEDAATNTFTVGNVKIDLTEPKWDPELGGTGKTEAADVYPGEALPKDPTVKNIGINPCFVRVKVEGLDCLKAEGDGDEMLIHVRTNYVADALGADWELHEDGYYYYKHVLAANETTKTPVFDSIVIPVALTNENGEEHTAAYNINVTAYAVQAQGARASFTAVQAMTVADIAAWFEICAPDTW
jgi:predicted ribosomally synthesized peptide with SipW-like signal peptide